MKKKEKMELQELIGNISNGLDKIRESKLKKADMAIEALHCWIDLDRLEDILFLNDLLLEPE